MDANLPNSNERLFERVKRQDVIERIGFGALLVLHL